MQKHSVAAVSPSAFELFGLEPSFDLDLDLLKERHQEMSAHMHPDKHRDKTPAERRRVLESMASLNRAYDVLASPVKRAELILEQSGYEPDESQRMTQPELLMEMMEARESLETLKVKRHDSQLQDMMEANTRSQDVLLTKLSPLCAKALACDSRASAEVAALLSTLRYYVRLGEELHELEFLYQMDEIK